MQDFYIFKYFCRFGYFAHNDAFIAHKSSCLLAQMASGYHHNESVFSQLCTICEYTFSILLCCISQKYYYNYLAGTLQNPPILLQPVKGLRITTLRLDTDFYWSIFPDFGTFPSLFLFLRCFKGTHIGGLTRDKLKNKKWTHHSPRYLDFFRIYQTPNILHFP